MWKTLALTLVIPTAVLAQQPSQLMPDNPPVDSQGNPIMSPGEFNAHKQRGMAIWRALCKPQPPLTPDQEAYAKAFERGDEIRKHENEEKGYDVYKQKADQYNAQCAALKAEDEREQREEKTQREEQKEQESHRVRVK